MTSFLPYPPIERHGVIGDRRTAALVAADGTIDWLCLPNYDSPPVFGALLDMQRGGHWRFGPAEPALGQQDYLDGTAVLQTTWDLGSGALELTDLMIRPADGRAPEDEAQRVIVRRLRCLRGEAVCRFELAPRTDFGAPIPFTASAGEYLARLGDRPLGLWCERDLTAGPESLTEDLHLRAGEQVFAALAFDAEPAQWTPERVETVLRQTTGYWHNWQDGLTYTGPRGRQVRRSALAVHLLSFAPTGALVAAPTTSLPEKIGGSRNFDYRAAWVRDASLSLAILSLLGALPAAKRYMDWLANLDTSTERPLQVLYRIDGGAHFRQQKREDLAGYRGSRPVSFGNHAFEQRQLDSLGYLADCALIYLKNGGAWRTAYWEMIHRVAEYTVDSWRLPDNGIWELGTQANYLNGKVMSWVVLHRAVKIAEHLGRGKDVDHWRSSRDAIHADVLEKGWSQRIAAYRQRDGADTLDAAVLLMAVMDFLPADDPRLLATAERIAERLMIDGLVHRFEPSGTPGQPDVAVGELEGAFLPCTFWLATTFAKSGQPDRAEAILRRAETIAGPLGLFAEEADARSGHFLGNTPLLFAQVEYVRAILETAKARPADRARLMAGRLRERLGQSLRRTMHRVHR